MADELGDLKEELLRAAREQAEQVASRLRPALPRQTSVDGVSAGSETEALADFATGYDSGTGSTVMPFMLGYSALGGDDVLTGTLFTLGSSRLGGTEVLG